VKSWRSENSGALAAFEGRSYEDLEGRSYEDLTDPPSQFTNHLVLERRLYSDVDPYEIAPASPWTEGVGAGLSDEALSKVKLFAGWGSLPTSDLHERGSSRHDPAAAGVLTGLNENRSTRSAASTNGRIVDTFDPSLSCTIAGSRPPGE
jgi:hypothetical protein